MALHWFMQMWLAASAVRPAIRCGAMAPRPDLRHSPPLKESATYSPRAEAELVPLWAYFTYAAASEAARSLLASA